MNFKYEKMYEPFTESDTIHGYLMDNIPWLFDKKNWTIVVSSQKYLHNPPADILGPMISWTFFRVCSTSWILVGFFPQSRAFWKLAKLCSRTLSFFALACSQSVSCCVYSGPCTIGPMNMISPIWGPSSCSNFEAQLWKPCLVKGPSCMISPSLGLFCRSVLEATSSDPITQLKLE